MAERLNLSLTPGKISHRRPYSRFVCRGSFPTSVLRRIRSRRFSTIMSRECFDHVAITTTGRRLSSTTIESAAQMVARNGFCYLCIMQVRLVLGTRLEGFEGIRGKSTSLRRKSVPVLDLAVALSGDSANDSRGIRPIVGCVQGRIGVKIQSQIERAMTDG